MVLFILILTAYVIGAMVKGLQSLTASGTADAPITQLTLALISGLSWPAEVARAIGARHAE